MAARPGEDLAVTLFADIHYYYGPPTDKPAHHRFDKGSYVYLFENASQRRARIEVANNAGTPEQDAFTGNLDNVAVDYSYDHTSLVTLTVEAFSSQRPLSSPNDWHLATYDPRNEKKYMYKLKMIDLYFWKSSDALQFLDAVRRSLPQSQISIKGSPTTTPVSAHNIDTNNIVQNLENIAITAPYHQNQHISRQSSHLSHNSPRAPLLPGPPPLISPVSHTKGPAHFAPMAYNPAAPAAPETIRHREKTPPPEDGAANPLVAAATADQEQHYGNQYMQHGSFATPPPQQHNLNGSLVSPGPQQSTYGNLHSPPQQQSNYHTGFTSPPPQQTASHPGLASPPPQQRTFQPGWSSPPPQQNTFQPGVSSPPPQQSSIQPGLASPPPQSSYFTGSTPSSSSTLAYAQQLASTPSFAAPPTNATVPPPPAPPNASPSRPVQSQPVYYFSNHGTPAPISASNSFAQAPLASPPLQSPGMNPSYASSMMGDYSIHSQVYRPNEGELAAKGSKKKEKERMKEEREKEKGQGPRGKLEDSAARIEGKVGGFLRKVEKRYL